jgi:DNA polymerase I
MDLKQLVDEVNGRMPEGITISIDGVWKAMYSYRMKSYFLLGTDGKLTVKGASLKGRNLERFGTAFLQEGLKLLLRRDIPGLRRLHLETRERVLNHNLGVGEFCRTEVLGQSLDEYAAETGPGASKKKPRRAVYELLLKHTGEPRYREGDRVSYYNCGTRASHSDIGHSKLAIHYDPEHPDENTAKLLKRLKEFTKRFKPAFTEEDFAKVFADEDISEEEVAKITPVARRTASAQEPEEDDHA